MEQLAQRIGAHVASIRSLKDPLRLSDINAFLEEVTAESSASIDAPPWELIGMFVTRLGSELSGILPKIKQAVNSGQVISSKFLS
jgi:dynactin 1